MILETKRLTLRELLLQDQPFIFKLINSEGWKKNIGDFGFKTMEDAANYLKNGPLKSYKENGFGIWLILEKTSNNPIGVCGLLKRDWLEHIDIGFALAPEFSRLGYAYEAAQGTINYAFEKLQVEKISAITIPQNSPSINLLNKLGFDLQKEIVNPSRETLLLFEKVLCSP